MPTVANAARWLLFAVLLMAGGAFAADLDQAKADGLVGETLEGYIDVVNESVPADVEALVEEINARRRAEYERIAAQNGIDIEQVEALAAKKAIDKTRPGGWVRLNGTWQQK
jgi:uncharacterized protein